MTLPEKITQELRALHQKLVNAGELPSKAQLTKYYDTFQQRFGPDKLQNLDGEALLEIMHEHGSRDSLVYWLEFKNDEEFPAIFGSIAGGSALKFGLYKRKETGVWMAGAPQNQQELSTAQAIDIARRHRDQLLQGTQLLAQLPENGTDDDYRRLQEQMDVVTPDVSQKAWGHKYFSLIYPDKLDDYHNSDYQRFHLITLLQTPPLGEGRYLVAGRYVAIANELDIPLNHLTSILNQRHDRPRRYWRVLVNYQGQKGWQNIWEQLRDGGYVAIGWANLGDLSHIGRNQESKTQVRELMKAQYGDQGGWAQEIFNFVANIEEGDIVLAFEQSTVLGIGKVTSSYEYIPSTPKIPHHRTVEWLTDEPWTLPQTEAQGRAIREIKNPINLVEVERRLHSPHMIKPPPPLVTPLRLEGVPGRIQAILDRKRQVILYGPPGTGKTFWAERAARDMAAYAHFGQAFDGLSSTERAVIVGKEQTDGLVRLCSFHPAYGYEDFLEGYRPHTIDDQLVFERRDGIFKKLCHDAKTNPTDKFYLIIDEINRGDIPRIFGELLTVLEKDKRQKSIILPLSGQIFQVPDNVYLIGTMNTADRSIALLDTALRRRFGFIELMPDSRVLGDTVVEGIPLGPWLDALNAAICEHIGRDARNLQIGHAYLLDNGQPVNSLARLMRIIQDDILPLLEEYCYEDYSTLAKILGKSLIDEPNQRVRHELFEPVRQDDLIQALLSIDPDIITSPQAVGSETAALDEEVNDSDEDLTLEIGEAQSV